MTLQKHLADIVGAANVLTAPEDTKPYFTDWRRQYSAPAECVVRPAATAEVARVVALCAREGVAVVPQGGNTGLVGGSVPTGAQREIVLALARMNRIRALDVLNDTITVEAGCVLAAVQRAADEAGRLFPLSLAAEGSCQIGGNLSTNAGGVNVLRYGNAREQVLGLEVVLPDGQVWDGLRGLRKDNTGYDLKQLFLGAEGTLGVITAAVLRLYPKPAASATAWIALGAAREAVELLAELRGRLGERISAFELVSRTCLEAVLSHVPGARDPLGAPHPWYVLAQFADTEDLLTRVEQALGGARSRDRPKRRAGAHAVAHPRKHPRSAVREREARHLDADLEHSRTSSSRPIALCKLRIQEPEIYCFGHVGDGNLHYNVGPHELLEKRDAVNRIVYQAVERLGGSISAEHGLGQLKREAIRSHKPPLELELMRRLKARARSRRA